MRLFIPTVGAILVLTGCRSAAPLQPPTAVSNHESKYVVSPKLGNKVTAEVGEPLYTEATLFATSTYQVSTRADAAASLDQGFHFDLKEGAEGVLLTRGRGVEKLLCRVADARGSKGLYGSKVEIGCLVDKTNTGSFTEATLLSQKTYYPLTTAVPYLLKPVVEETVRQDDFRIEVLYQGISRGAIKISYREFLNNVARQAFNQDVSYELESNGPTVIGFKGMRLRVLKADSLRIEYVLEQPIPSHANMRPPLPVKPLKDPKVWWQD